MAYCTNCGKELEEGAKFCANCGKSVEGNCISAQRKTVYDGELHKCPNCGEVLESFVANCPACGYEFRGTKNSSTVREFATKLEEIEKTRPSGKISLKEVLKDQREVSKTDLGKISLIRSFAIPNTKEDLLEFLVLAASNINLQRYNDFDSISEAEQAVSDAWEAKFEQAYQKAVILIGTSPEFENVQKLYEKKKSEVSQAKKKRVLFWILFPTIILVVVSGLIFLGVRFL